MRIGVGLSIPELATRGGRFSPASLFTGGVQGAWYDPSDYSTLFQDSVGTTPVTAVEQPVGLMLDKSQGLVLGSELVGSPYTGAVGGSWLIGSSAITRNGSATSQASLTLSATPSTSKTYLVQFTVADLSGDTFGYRIGGGTAYQVTANGTYTSRITGGGASVAMTFIPWAGSAGQATITNISVRELPGNHASQSTAASRPILRARYNLLTYSEQFDNAAWVLSAATVTANSTTAPDGTTTADTITFSSVAGRVQRAINMASQCISIYVKPIVGTRFAINTDGVSGADATIFNLSGSGSVVSTGANNNSSVITALADGWYRIVTARGSTAGTNIYLGALNSGGGSTDSFYIWGADLRTGSSAGTYQRIAAATDYATAGFLPYLAFDGTDDSFGTNSINFSATDKMSACAGVTKLSDAAVVILAELSVSLTTNAGTFYMAAPETTGASGDFSINGRGSGVALPVLSGTILAPATRVFTALFDIATPARTLRLNGAQIATNSGSIGTGNFGNYPLFIGRRNNTSFPFNGRIYQMVVCGKALSASELAALESFTNSKTGAY